MNASQILEVAFRHLVAQCFMELDDAKFELSEEEAADWLAQVAAGRATLGIYTLPNGDITPALV